METWSKSINAPVHILPARWAGRVKHMDFQEVKSRARIEKYAEDHLERKGRTFVCPACGSGNGPNGTPAFSIKEDRFKCFSCDAGGDVFDLAGIVEGTEDKHAQLRAVAEWAGIALDIALDEDSGSDTFRSRKKGNPGTGDRTGREMAAKQPTAAQKRFPDYKEGRERHSSYVAGCRANIHDPEAVAYLASRGITEEEAVALGLGYDPAAPRGWKDAAGTWHRGGRIVIPWKGSDYYHIDRAVSDSATDGKYNKPSSEEVGPQPLYNHAALDADSFFIVEGALDAVAVELCGFQAVALGGTGSRAVAQAIGSKKPRGVAMVMLDSDGAGEHAAKELGDLLDASQVDSIQVDMPEHKDAAEWLAADREGLRSFLQMQHDNALAAVSDRREERYNKALKAMRVLDPLEVAASIYALEDATEPLPTGFDSLDDVLNGGLQAGSLYVLGATSSFGKTTLSVQIADHIAESGRSVLFVTIEQSAREIVAKSLSRIMSVSGCSYSTSEITSASRRAGWQEADRQRLISACETYSSGIARHLRIYEGMRQPGVEDIAAVVADMADHDGAPPAIFIDYLQLMAPQSDRDGDKQAVDKNVMSLRQMARDLNTPIFVISSLNRSSYSGSVTMDAFKESGAIEYGSDVLIGLQPRGMREQMEGDPEAQTKRKADLILRKNRASDKRECELVVLKNRNGRVPLEGLPLRFKPTSSRFIEGASAIPPKPRRI